MVQSNYVMLQDRSIDSQDADLLDRMPFVDSLARALVREEYNDSGILFARRATGNVIGLTGRWGLGKSSVLNLLKSRLESLDHVTVALFNPWLFNGRDELLRAFFKELRDAMGRSPGENAATLVTALDRYWGAIDLAAHGAAAAIDLLGAGGAATTGWQGGRKLFRKAFKKPNLASPQDERRQLEKKLKDSNAAVVVLIDELDRVEDDEVRAVAQLIKAIGDIKGISYLVAYDPDRVTKALGRGNAKRGTAYLEKIIQHPIPLRPLFEEDVELLLKAALAESGIALADSNAEHESAILKELVRQISTPRDVKRLVGAYSILEPAVRGEICAYDVLGYAWIVTKAPQIRERIAADLDAVVNDPTGPSFEKHLSRRLDNEKPLTLSEALEVDVGDQIKLLEILFPSFAKQKMDGQEKSDRICRRRNLVRLLYLGNPPSMISRREVEDVWNQTDMLAMYAALSAVKESGRLRALLDRLDDLLASLDSNQDTIFWPALAKLLVRPTDWIQGPDELGAIFADASQLLSDLTRRDRKQAYRLQPIIDALIEDGDLVLVPSLLRRQMFANGLTRHSPRSSSDAVLTPTETDAVFERELPRYRSAVINGTALRRLPNCEVIFAICNRERWDADLQSSFLEQLQGAAALSTFAALLVPPGHGAEPSLLDELANADEIRARIDELKEAGDWPEDPYLSTCLKRLRATTRGNTIHYWGEDDEEEETS